MGNYRPTMTHYTAMDFIKCYELLWRNSGFADVIKELLYGGKPLLANWLVHEE